MDGYVDPETGRLVMKGEESDNWVAEVFRTAEEMAAISRRMRYDVGRQAMYDLAHGADAFNVARMMTELTILCDVLEEMPNKMHEAIKILPDPEPDTPPKPGRYLGRTDEADQTPANEAAPGCADGAGPGRTDEAAA